MQSAKPSLLIIDDDSVIRVMLCRHLGSRGYPTFEASGGKEGLELFAQHHPDIVLTDLLMPGVSGLEVLRHVREASPDTPVIMISGANGTDDVVAALRYGAQDYITKPFTSLEPVESAIESATDRLRRQEQVREYQRNLEARLRQQGRQTALLQQIAAVEHEQHGLVRKRLEQTDLLLDMVQRSITGYFGQELFDQIVLRLAEWLGCEFAMIAELIDPETLCVLSAWNKDGCIRGQKLVFHGSPCERAAQKGYLEISEGMQDKFSGFGKAFGFMGESYVGVALRGDGGAVIGTLCAASGRPLNLPDHTQGLLNILAARVAAELERVRLESQLRQSQKMEMLGQLAGGIVHDHNNLLSAIMGYAEILHNRIGENETLKRYAKTVLDASRRAADLSQRLLRFSRRTGKRHEKLDLHQVIGETMELLGRTIESRITLRTFLSAENHHVLGDQSELQNALMNLCINARDAIDGCGEITISTRLALLDEISARHKGLDGGEYLLLTVTDTGKGMDAVTQARIFDPFFTTKGEQKGTGLGLTMVYQGIRQHGGCIQVRSDVGQGTTFSLYLPVVANADHPDSGGGDRAGIQAPETGTILIVDDEELIRTLAQDMLRGLGYELIPAQDGPEAVAIYRERHAEIGLVILDLMMPVMNGLETHRALCRIDPETVSILCTGYEYNDVLDIGEEPGIVDTISKPFSIDTITRAIQKAMRQRQEQSAAAQ